MWVRVPPLLPISYEKAYFKEEPQRLCDPCEEQEGRSDPFKNGEAKKRQEQAG